MSNVNLDFSNVRGGTVLEEGVYNVVIETVEEKVSSTGKNMLSIRFREESTKNVLFENYILEENCLWKLKDLLSAAGISTNNNVALDTDELIGLSFKAKIIKEQYNGLDVNRIKKIFAA